MFPVVAVQEELDDKFVHFWAFGKRKGLAHQPPQALARGVVEPLDVVGGTRFGTSWMLSGGEPVVVALPVIGSENPLVVTFENPRPEHAGGSVLARPQGVGNDGAGTLIQSQPEPDHTASAMTDEGPHFIQFQYLSRLKRNQRGFQGWQVQGFF